MAATTIDDPARAAVPWLVVMAASIGGVQALRRILAELPSDLGAAVVIVQHRPPYGDSQLESVLGYRSQLPVRLAEQGEPLRPDCVYLARPDFHLTLTPERSLVYRNGTKVQYVRSAANPLLESAARVLEDHVIAIVLSGGGSDATDGVQTVKAHGGIVIAQDEATSALWDMPRAAIESGAVDYVLPIGAIAGAIDDIVRGRPIAAAAPVPL